MVFGDIEQLVERRALAQREQHHGVGSDGGAGRSTNEAGVERFGDVGALAHGGHGEAALLAGDLDVGTELLQGIGDPAGKGGGFGDSVGHLRQRIRCFIAYKASLKMLCGKFIEVYANRQTARVPPSASQPGAGWQFLGCKAPGSPEVFLSSVL